MVDSLSIPPDPLKGEFRFADLVLKSPSGDLGVLQRKLKLREEKYYNLFRYTAGCCEKTTGDEKLVGAMDYGLRCLEPVILFFFLLLRSFLLYDGRSFT